MEGTQQKTWKEVKRYGRNTTKNSRKLKSWKGLKKMEWTQQNNMERSWKNKEGTQKTLKEVEKQKTWNEYKKTWKKIEKSLIYMLAKDDLFCGMIL